ncbi:hypothetical protein GKZ28_08680 [Clostridium chromiireducens]|jgi:hypothetical protein|uniref:Uncharacterized protein n=1 Tax=Clostridium chromiireducens TaxID=225345 RepID=A0A964RLC1_9CLOT|nr:hypothetical protein [Clostridium chromiireducens]MVX63769.1 hypothetical protein [Clostridium chromiireducens]
MSHPIPRELTGEERIFSIPYLNLHFSKKATVYCLVASVISGLTLKINFYLFLSLFLILNSIAYPISTMRVSKNKFEGGNVPMDIYLFRKFKYSRNKRIYLRRRGK